MHEIHIPEDILAKSRARRGRVEVFDALDSARTALVVIDMQSYFLKPGGFLEVPCSRDIVGNINRIAATLRPDRRDRVLGRSTVSCPNGRPGTASSRRANSRSA